jgi:hypothetical protein
MGITVTGDIGILVEMYLDDETGAWEEQDVLSDLSVEHAYLPQLRLDPGVGARRVLHPGGPAGRLGHAGGADPAPLTGRPGRAQLDPHRAGRGRSAR